MATSVAPAHNPGTRRTLEDGDTAQVFLQKDATGAEITPPSGAQIGAVNETAPASDTASSGLNGRLQRIAQRLTSLITNMGTLVFGTGTAAAAQRVVLATDGGLPTVGYSASASFTPAAASHVAGDVNGAAGTFTTMGLSAGRIIITSASLEIDGATAEATAWRLYLFNVTPPSALADDAAFTLPSGDRASFLGYVDLGTAVDLGDTQWVETNGINKQLKLAGANLFAYLVNLTTLTPAAVAHTVTLHAVAV